MGIKPGTLEKQMEKDIIEGGWGGIEADFGFISPGGDGDAIGVGLRDVGPGSGNIEEQWVEGYWPRSTGGSGDVIDDSADFFGTGAVIEPGTGHIKQPGDGI